MKKHWAFIRVLYESYYFGVVGPGFLNQVPTLASSDCSFDSHPGPRRIGFAL